MSPEEKAFSEALDAYELLLNAETQAIVSTELDKLEQIIKDKDQTLKLVLLARDVLTFDPREDPILEETLDRILKIQSRNSQTLNNLIARRTPDGGDLTPEDNSLIRKIRTAYLSQHTNGGKRFEV
ncbi:MAG: hypothetical protein HN494_03655 [Opitutae bacterium]|nr:hypothetical protein [Opitutae bacterium]MBT5908903.1 hypothetical protein [Opitutae bacterium]MBT7740239.1 hypothetical protein [Opitutae bacterium]MBT7923706.1 hypothetical protein [Opitutae bacterium]